MKPDDALLFEISDLLIKGMDNALSKAEFDRFQELLKTSKAARQCYFELLSTCAGVEDIHGMVSCNESFTQGLDLAAWEALADNEKTAPAILIEKPKPSVSSIAEPVSYERRVNKASLLVAMASLAALFFMITFANISAPSRVEEVATIVDSLHTKWINTDIANGKTIRLTTDRKPLTLEQGLVKIQFDNHAKVVVEAPAQFEIVTGDQIKLNYGRTYSTVPKEAVGFTITTPNSKIVDLGTEFGIQTNKNGVTELHVIKGKTTLVSGAFEKVSETVICGNAKIIDGPQARASSIDCEPNRFVREFNSKNQTVWRGESLDLADVVGGGNGFGAGVGDFGISPVTGNPSAINSINRSASNSYIAFETNPFIDGVFVPNGQTPQIVSTEGHVFEDCPVTQGNYYLEIAHSPRFLVPDMTIGNSLAEKPCILMHANLGITFNLDAIRSRLDRVGLKRFETQIYISAMAPRIPNADFWILIDGKVRFSRKHVTEIEKREAVSVELQTSDHFLTLVTTDGGDPDDQVNSDGTITKSINSDWCVFGNPVLTVE